MKSCLKEYGQLRSPHLHDYYLLTSLEQEDHEKPSLQFHTMPDVYHSPPPGTF